MQPNVHHPAMTRAEAALLPAVSPAPRIPRQALLHAPGINLPGVFPMYRRQNDCRVCVAQFRFMCYNGRAARAKGSYAPVAQ